MNKSRVLLVFTWLTFAATAAPNDPVKEAEAERDRLGAPNTLRTLILSTKGTRIYPAFAVFDKSKKTLYFAERLLSGTCAAKNLWAAVLPLTKEDPKAVPKKLETIDCVQGLDLQGDRLYVQFEANSRRGFTEYAEKLELATDPLSRSSKWFKQWRWKKDLWEDWGSKPFSLTQMNFLSSILDEKAGTLRLYGQVAGQADIRRVDINFADAEEEKLPKVSNFALAAGSDELKAATDDKTPTLTVDPTNQFVYRFLGNVGDEKLGRLVVWNFASPDKPTVYGSKYPYIYRRVWDELKPTRWAARQFGPSTLTERGIVFADTTTESNEWAVVTYFSPYLPASDKSFTRIKGVQGSEVGGISYFNRGLILSLSDKQEVVYLLAKGEKSDFPTDIYQTAAPDEIEKGRDDK